MTFFHDWLDRIMIYGPCLPLKLTSDSESRWSRVLGMIWFLFWVIPAFAVVLLPFIVCLYGTLIEDAWNGENA
jgi:uncharacterized protein YqgC (DUF456 family)